MQASTHQSASPTLNTLATPKSHPCFTKHWSAHFNPLRTCRPVTAWAIWTASAPASSVAVPSLWFRPRSSPPSPTPSRWAASRLRSGARSGKWAAWATRLPNTEPSGTSGRARRTDQTPNRSLCCGCLGPLWGWKDRSPERGTGRSWRTGWWGRAGIRSGCHGLGCAWGNFRLPRCCRLRWSSTGRFDGGPGRGVAGGWRTLPGGGSWGSTVRGEGGERRGLRRPCRTGPGCPGTMGGPKPAEMNVDRD